MLRKRQLNTSVSYQSPVALTAHSSSVLFSPVVPFSVTGGQTLCGGDACPPLNLKLFLFSTFQTTALVFLISKHPLIYFLIFLDNDLPHNIERYVLSGNTFELV